MKVLKAPNPILKTPTRPVKKITPDLLQMAKEMIKTAQSFKDPEGVGLSANQIGRKEKFFVAKINKKFDVYINPEIVSTSKKVKTFFEGCLSVPAVWGEIERPITVTVKYQDKAGQIIKKRLTGTKAWIFQHEIDHLSGKLFIDQVLAQKGKVFKVVGKDQAGADIFEEIKI